jgi:hypothetical protein
MLFVHSGFLQRTGCLLLLIELIDFATSLDARGKPTSPSIGTKLGSE